MAQSRKPELKTIEPYDVSFVEIPAGDTWKETVQRVARAIDVQFTESSNLLPFVPFREFQKLLYEEKIFLFGPSGCGKSRTIIELLKNNKANNGRIFVISPANSAGLDSSRENISMLSERFRGNDLVIWDDFPNGLVKRDLQSAFGALEVINSRPVQNLYISLKPTYLEMYRDLTVGIPDLYTCEIVCDLDVMKALVRTYGNNVDQFKSVFEKYVSANSDRIARALWQKQPLSLTVVDYYKALVCETEEKERFDSTNALSMAQTWLPAHDYFERQFEVMKGIEERRDDVDFLHVLRFCYEVGLDRTPDLIAVLQKEIFGSSTSIEPTRKLRTWIYLSGQSYAMHDSAKNAVRLTEYAKMKMTSYLVSRFLEMIPKSNAQLHSLGLFLGRNIQFVPKGNDERIVPDNVYGFMKRNAVFERAIGHGVGEEFEMLDDSLQDIILDYVDTEIEFGVGLADSLGERFAELDDHNKKRVLEKIYQGMLFARYFGQSVGRLYGNLQDELRSVIMSHAEKNPQFADGLGMGIGYVYSSIVPELQQEIMRRAQKSFEISRGLGFGFGLTFALMQENEAKEMIAMADGNSELDTGFGMGLGASYSNLPITLQRFVLERIVKDCEFGFGVGIYGAFANRESCPKELLDLLYTNTEMANGLGLGFGTGFFYLPEQFRSDLEGLLKTNIRLDEGVGTGIGIVLKHVPSQVQDMFIGKAHVSNGFAIGFGYGVGFTWHYLDDAVKQKAIRLANTNGAFSRGLGIGLGSHIDFLGPMLPHILGLADANSELDRGLGAGAAWAWPYFSDESRSVVLDRIKNNSEFAKGIGFGIARIVRHFPDDEKQRIAARLADDPSFSAGFGEGTAYYLWSVFDKHEKERFLKQAEGSAEIARGLGTGLGFLHSFFKGELDKSCRQLFKENPNFRMGLGAGTGMAYVYLPEGDRLEAFRRAETNVEFATGFGEGIGTIFGSLDMKQKERVMSYAEGGTGFSRGLGKGLGLAFPYLTDDLKNEVLQQADHNEQLSRGLGSGIAERISYLSESVASRIFEVAKNNKLLAVGLGEGCGVVFSRLRQVTKDWLSSYANIDGYAFGLGIGIGKRQTDMDNVKATGLARGYEFSEGVAIGLGSIVAGMPKDALAEILPRAVEDRHFARNFGFALGHTFSTLAEDKRKDLLEISNDNEDLLAGLGEGVGHNLPSSGSRLIEEIMMATTSVEFEKGVAKGIAESFRYLSSPEALGVLEYAGSYSRYGEVLGEGLAERFASFGEDTQSIILDSATRDSNFSRAFARTIARSMMYVSAKMQKKMNDLLAQYPHLSTKEEKK